MLLDEITTLLAASSTALVAHPSTGGTPIFRSHFPDAQPNTAIALFESGGRGPAYTQAGTLDHERPTIQVLSRSTSYQTARLNAETVFGILSGVENSTLSGTYYVDITPAQSPFGLGRDPLDRFLVSCNYLIGKGVS